MKNPTLAELEKEKLEPIAWILTIVFSSMLLSNNSKTSFLLVTVYLIVSNFKSIPDMVRNVHKSAWIIILQLWAGLSFFWSVVPSVTLDVVAVQVGFLVMGIFMARYCIDKDLTRSLKTSAYLVIGIIILYSLFHPAEAISPQGFKAFYPQKNNLGMVVGICSLILIYSPKARFFDYILGMIAFIILLSTQSKTSIFIVTSIFLLTLAILGFKYLFNKFSKASKDLLILLSGAIPWLAYALIIAMVISRDLISGFLIRVIPYDFFTGRGEIWVTVLRRTNDDLLLGLGAGTFWEAGRRSEIAQTSLFTKHPGWIETLPSADGGYIDIVGGIGFVGLALILASFVTNYCRVIKVTHNKEHWTIFALITFFFGHNFTETSAYHLTNPLWFIYLFISFYMVFLLEKNSSKPFKLEKTLSRE